MKAQSKKLPKGEAKFESVGKSLASGLARGILSGVGKVISAAESIVEKGVAAAKKKADVNSPSKVMRDQVGLPLAEGLEVGMHKGAPQVASAAADMVNDTVDAANAAAAKAKIDTSKLTLSPAEAQAAIAANIDSMSAQAKLAVQYEMDRQRGQRGSSGGCCPHVQRQSGGWGCWTSCWLRPRQARSFESTSGSWDAPSSSGNGACLMSQEGCKC